MRSLRVRLTLAFLVVGLLGVAAGAIVASRRASGAFQEFTFARNQEGLVASLTSYYAENGTWNGLAAQFPHGPGGPAGQGVPLREPWSLILTDPDGRVVISGPGHQPGEVLPSEMLAGAT